MEDFPITWEDPADAARTWVYNEEHVPLPMSPLLFDLTLAPFLRGFGWGIDPRQFNYYTFFAFDGPRDTTEPQEADVAYLGMAASRWYEQILPEVEGYVEHYRTAAFDDMKDKELSAEIQRLGEVRFRSGQLHTQCVTPYHGGHRLLIDTYKELVADDELAALRLAQGHRNKSVEAGERLWDIAQLAAAIPSVREACLQGDATAIADRFAGLASVGEAGPFVSAFQTYLDDFGWRIGNDDTGETWIEDPTVPLTMLRTYLTMPQYDPRDEQRRLVEDREAAVRDAMAKLDEAGQARLAEVVDAVVGVSMLSEDHNFYIDQRLATTPRRLLLAAGRRLTSKGVLADPAQVFYLRAAELSAALEQTGEDLAAVCNRRAEELAYWRTRKPPPFVGVPPAEGAPGAEAVLSLTDEPGDELRGLAASSGVARGPARILLHLSEAGRLRPGDVLVVPVTSPPWTPLFAVASAVVTEVGGALSHTAVVAREYAIPAVVNVRDATKRLRDGQLVEVDGSAGGIRVLD